MPKARKIHLRSLHLTPGGSVSDSPVYRPICSSVVRKARRNGVLTTEDVDKVTCWSCLDLYRNEVEERRLRERFSTILAAMERP